MLAGDCDFFVDVAIRGKAGMRFNGRRLKLTATAVFRDDFFSVTSSSFASYHHLKAQDVGLT